MKKSFCTISLLSLLILPLPLFAMEHNMAGMEHGTNNSGAMSTKMVTIGTQTVSQVKAELALKDVREIMATMGMKQTHHLMVHFLAADNTPITAGSAVVTITGGDGKVIADLAMMGMDGHFGVDVVLEQKGLYHFTVKTQLNDKVARDFAFKYEVR